jgi:hypothetical protein
LFHTLFPLFLAREQLPQQIHDEAHDPERQDRSSHATNNHRNAKRQVRHVIHGYLLDPTPSIGGKKKETGLPFSSSQFALQR